MASHQHGFAKKEMNRCGWSEGKGLGRSENGMKDAIKVKIKNNKGGLGHDEGAEFTFHWWDHIFNKAANSFKVSESEEGALIEKCEGKKITPFLISNKKPLSSKFANTSLTYGTFVKAGTYNDNKELSDCLTDNDSSEESSDDNENLSVNDTLDKAFKQTGLTGHKAARHGFNLSGKLQRIQKQEQNQSPASLIYSQRNENDTDKGGRTCNNINGEMTKKKNSKDVKRNSQESKLDKNHTQQEVNIQICDSDKPKKKKKKKKAASEKDVEVENLSEIEKPACKLSNCVNEVASELKKRKHKLKKEVDVLENQPRQKKKKKSKSIKEEF